MFGVGLRFGITLTLILNIVYCHSQIRPALHPAACITPLSVQSPSFLQCVAALVGVPSPLLQMYLPYGEWILDRAHSCFGFELDESLEVSGTLFSCFFTIDPVGTVLIKVLSARLFHFCCPFNEGEAPVFAIPHVVCCAVASLLSVLIRSYISHQPLPSANTFYVTN